jgi:hypothetical protein
MTPSYDTFRLQNDDIRPGSSPQDLSAVVRVTGGTVSVPFKAGTKVYYIDMTEATVTSDVNGNPVVDLSAAAGDKAMICAAAIHMQI